MTTRRPAGALADGIADRLRAAQYNVDVRRMALGRALIDRELGHGDSVETARADYQAALAALTDLELLREALPLAMADEQAEARQRAEATNEQYRAEHRAADEQALAAFERDFPTLPVSDGSRGHRISDLWPLAKRAGAVAELRALFATHRRFTEFRDL